ncbi:hypothetical protein O3G_MSEX008048 [Manduca sexta]|uniref:Uncharacterized protein n=1 Tax=Manduca sexta TaxID=7130 RepID=A0A921Z8K0_MANSE|nr:hypothetical protein O3G_MSEX008048 [Manduca sexta]
MSSEILLAEEPLVEVIYEQDDFRSSEEPPMDEWSSLVLQRPQMSKKQELFEQGLYHPGSGNVCGKYLATSDSVIAKHPYFTFPSVKDPGIKAALLQPQIPIIHADDGQDLYLALCDEIDICPVRAFHKGLVEKNIDLRYYCVNPRGVRCMASALRFNRTVKVLNLTDSFLNEDACFHLGEMLVNNSALEELNLSGCRIGFEGAKRLFHFLPFNRTLRELNLNKNHLGDESMVCISKAIFKGIDVQRFHLSYNNIGQKGASFLATAFETHNKFVLLDLSWNSLISGSGTYNLLCRLEENKVLQDLNLAWNGLTGPRIGTAITKLMKSPNLHTLNLSNNRLNGEAITNLTTNMTKLKKLVTLDLSYNPMTPADAIEVLSKFLLPAVKVQRLIMENVFVNLKFLALLKQVREMKSRKNTVITYGGLVGCFKPVGPDPRNLLLSRVDYLCQKQKRNRVDIALVVLQLEIERGVMPVNEFLTVIKDTGAPLDNDLLNEIVNVFPGPSTAKAKTVDIKCLADYVKRKWPDKKLPPVKPSQEQTE